MKQALALGVIHLLLCPGLLWGHTGGKGSNSVRLGRTSDNYEADIAERYRQIQLKPESITLRLDLAKKLKDYGDNEQALIEVHHVLTLDPTATRAYLIASEVLDSEKRFQELVRLLADGYKRVVINRSIIGERLGCYYYYASRDRRRARRLLQRLIHAHPFRWRARYCLGSTYLDLEQYEQAMTEFAAISDSASEFRTRARIKVAQTHALLAKDAQRRGNDAIAHQERMEALGQLSRARRFGNLDDTERFMAAMTYHELDEYQDALRAYQKLKNDKPTDRATLNNLAWLLVTAKDSIVRSPFEAVKHSHRAVELSRWTSDTYIDTLAEAHYQSGAVRSAIDTIRQSILLNPTNEYYTKQLRRFDNHAQGYQPKDGFRRVTVRQMVPGSE